MLYQGQISCFPVIHIFVVLLVNLSLNLEKECTYIQNHDKTLRFITVLWYLFEKDIRRFHVERNLNAFIVYVPEYSGSSLLMQVIKGEDNLNTWLGPFCEAHENSWPYL